MRGLTVTLWDLAETGQDDFGFPIWTETPVSVENVLVGEPSTEDVTTATSLYGKRLVCMLGIPKGDAHVWTDRRVSWTGPDGRTVTVRTFGYPITGVEALIPGPWHMKVRCEAIE